MNEQTGERSPSVERKLERAIILELLVDGGERRRPRAQLAAALGVESEVLENALRQLSGAGVVCVSASEVWASAVARRIDELGLIGI